MPHVTLHAHCLQTAPVCWRSAKNERHCIGRTMYLHGNVLAFFREIMLELHYYRNGYSAYKRCEVGCNGPIITGGLHGNIVPSRHYLGFHSKDFPETPHLSLQLYCLETKSVWLASAINEWQVFYVTYIHQRGTALGCYSFLFISIRLQACCVIHFYSSSLSMCV